jgi:hypothetical protein
MSQQLRVRFYGNRPESEYESNLISKAFDLFESLKDSLGVANFLAVPMTSNEEDLMEIIEEELGGEPDDYGWEEFEENVERKLGTRGDFFSASELIETVRVYRDYFGTHSQEIFNLRFGRHTSGQLIAEDLRNLENELAASPSGRARFVIN